MNAEDVILLAAGQYNDTAFARIKESSADGQPNWLDWLNDAQRAVVLVRPDANSVIANIGLVAGTKQAVPASYTRMLGVTRNMGADGNTPGKTIRLIDRQTLDDYNRDWHNDTAASSVEEIVYDDKKTPTVFYTVPPMSGATQIEAQLAKLPSNIAVPGDPIELSDVYVPPMVEWMLYRAYSLQAQAQGLTQRAAGHYQSFFNLLGVKLRGDFFFSSRQTGQYPLGAPNAPG